MLACALSHFYEEHSSASLVNTVSLPKESLVAKAYLIRITRSP